MPWIDVPHPYKGGLAFRYDPERALIEGQHKGQKFYVDLQEEARKVAVDKASLDAPRKVCNNQSR